MAKDAEWAFEIPIRRQLVPNYEAESVSVPEAVAATPDSKTSSGMGLLYALLAYGWWGVITPLYFYVLRAVPPAELLAWRVLSGLPTVLLLLWVIGRLPEVRTALRDPRTFRTLGLSSVLLALGWLAFLWAIITDRLTDASFGYFLAPMVSVSLGITILGEKVGRLQLAAIALAAAGIVAKVLSAGHVPWIALVIASTFGVYGMLRKRVDVAAAPGLAVEMLLLFTLMLGLAVVVHFDTGTAFLTGAWWVTTLLLLGGVQTIVPLLFFVGAARRLRLTTLGILQYLAPTGQLLLAILVFGEPLRVNAIVAFGFVWLAILAYTIGSMRSRRPVQLPM